MSGLNIITNSIPVEERPYGTDAVNAALREWKEAVRYFENVKDPELVDFAIYEMEAARRKYMFLLKRIKK